MAAPSGSAPVTPAASAAQPPTAGGPHIPPVPGASEREKVESLIAAAEVDLKVTLEHIGEADVLAKFRAEHEKLHRSLKRSVETGSRIFEQFSRLHQTYHENLHTARLLAESATQEEVTLRTLRMQIRRANDFLDSARVKEDKSKDELRQLRIQVTDLKSTVSQGVGLSAAQERNVGELMKAKEEALKELGNEMDRIAHLRGRIADVGENTRQLDMERRTMESDIHSLKEKCAARKIDVDIEMRNKDALETDLREMRTVVSAKIAEVKAKQENVNHSLEDIAMLQNQVKTQKQMLEKMVRDHENQMTKAAKYREDCDQQVMITNSIVEENNGIIQELKKKEMDMAKITNELLKSQKIHSGLQKKVRQLESKKRAGDEVLHQLKEDNDQILKRTDEVKLDIGNLKGVMDDLTREKSVLQQSMKRLTMDSKQDQHLLQLLQPTRLNLEQESHQNTRDLAHKRRVLQKLLTEKEDCDIKIASLQDQISQAQTLIKTQEAEIFRLKKQVVDSATKLKYQQNLFETMQSDRNLQSKNLISSQQDITEMKRQLKIMNFQINGLKEEYELKKDQIAREFGNREKLDKEIEAIDTEINNLHQQNELAQAYIRSQISEENKLGQYVKEAEAEKQKRVHTLSLVVSERDRLSAQLIKQDDELLQVYDSIKANQFALLRGQKHYVQKKRQLVGLENYIRQAMTDKKLLDLATRDFDVYKKAVLQLKAELLQECGHIKVLSDEIKNPINIHRWRRLEGSDPGKLETIELIHSLQRALLAKASEDRAKENEIHSKEVTYLQLKEIQSRQVGPEAVEQLAIMEAAKKDKSSKLKHMMTEVEMYRAKIKEHKYILSGMNRQLRELKSLYFHMKKSRKDEGGGFGGGISRGSPSDGVVSGHFQSQHFAAGDDMGAFQIMEEEEPTHSMVGGAALGRPEENGALLLH